MALQTLINANNVVLAVAPPEYFVPNTAGAAVPAGATSWQLQLDTTGLPAGQLLASVTVEFQRNAWTDKAGGVHPANEWLPDVGGSLQTGPQGKSGGAVATLGSSIGAIAADGSMVEPYPTHARLRVTSCPGWTLPNVKLITQ